MINQGKITCLGGYLHYTKTYEDDTTETFYCSIIDVDTLNNVLSFIGTIYRIGENGVVSIPELTSGEFAIRAMCDFSMTLETISYADRTSY